MKIDKKYSFNAEDDWGDYENGKPRKGYITSKGYHTHHYLLENGERKTMLEHRAKWEYFNGEIPKGMEIDHIIPISMGGTNKLSNLRIVSHKDNMNNTNTKVLMAKKEISNETKKRMSESAKGRTPWNKGKTNIYSDDTIKKISESQKKIKRSPLPTEVKQKISDSHIKKIVYQYTTGDMLVKVWKQAKQAEETLGYSRSGIAQACNGQLKTYKGYRWSYEPL